MVRLVDVARSYTLGGEAVAALRGVSLEIARGERVALVGPSGCGKSTLLNLVAGVDRADGGEVWVAGIDLTRADERALVRLRRQVVGVVFQGFHLMPNLSVEENVSLPLALAGRRDPARVAGLIERVGLTPRRRHLPSELSGGEQQRTAIARALANSPLLLVADEPTGNLDTQTGRRVLDLLEELSDEEGTTLLLVTHDLELAARAGRVVSMRDGRLA
jgi:putative ABC transport system ATP-binding protein